MDKRVTCPSCDKIMSVKIWSDTLTQVLKCSSCGKKFTYDPSKEPVEKAEEVSTRPPKRNGENSVSRIIGKGVKNGINMAAAPVKSAKREIDRMVESINSIANSKPPEAVTSMINRKAERDRKDAERDIPKSSEKPSGKRETSKAVRCPQCTWVFQAGLPDNEKMILTTKCPECSKVFSFDRDQPPVKEETVKELKETIPRDDEDFAIPLSLKEKMGREGMGEGETGKLAQPPEYSDISAGGARDRMDTDTLELAPEPRRRGGQRGRLLSVTCPYCSESFGTPAPRNRVKVVCPICEEEFGINAHGEYIAKKALGSFSGGLARIVGVEAIRRYQDTFRDSLEGMTLIRDRDNLRYHMRGFSGKAGFLLIIVSLLGILFAGSLILSIPGSGEDDPSGSVVLSGNVICGLELLEGADVTITDLAVSDTTNSEGEFHFNDVAAGDHTLEVTAQDKGTLIVHFTVGTKEGKQGSKDLGGQVLPEEGSVERDLREDRVDRAGLVLGLQALFIIIVSLLALMGGLLAIQGKRFHATIFLAGISIVSIGFFIGIFLAILSVILIILGKKEFIS